MAQGLLLQRGVSFNMENRLLNAIMSVRECDCGAVTLYLSNDREVSCAKENMKEFLGFTYESLMHFVKESGSDDMLGVKYYSCNHCVNRWGIDLCACGSGEKVGECNEGLKECGKPMQSIDGYLYMNGGYWRI